MHLNISALYPDSPYKLFQVFTNSWLINGSFVFVRFSLVIFLLLQVQISSYPEINSSVSV